MVKLKPMPRDIYVKICPKCAYVAGQKDYSYTNCWFCDTEMIFTDILYKGINKGGKWVQGEGTGDILSKLGMFDENAFAARWAGETHWTSPQPTQQPQPTTPPTPPTLTTCPVCGGKVSSAAPACPHCGQPMKEPEPAPVAAPQPVKPAEEKNVPKCPTCGSTNIRRVDGLERSMSFFLWGFGSRKVNKSYKCLHCDYTW